MAALTLTLLLWLPLAAHEVDDPKIQRMFDSLPSEDSEEPSGPMRFPKLQLGYTYAGSFGLEEAQGEHIVSIHTWPWQHHWRFGLGIELGVLDTDAGGHLGLSLALGRQGRLPFHWYTDVSLMGGVYRVNLYQAEVIAPISRLALHGGFGFAVGRVHVTLGLVLERLDLFLSTGRISGYTAGFEMRFGL